MTPQNVLLTGGSGYVGKLIAASLIEFTDSNVVATVRSAEGLAEVRGSIERELSASRRHEAAKRLQVVILPGGAEQHYVACLREHRISQVVHCAGSVDYTDSKKLIAANVELTRTWLAAAKDQKIDRFVHISTAFSAGCEDNGIIREELHADPRDSIAYMKTTYMKTKRDAERLVVESGIPFVILRPSILVGDSGDGHYFGKPYGVYQFWKTAERLLCDQWRPQFHVVAPPLPLPLLHQDHFMAMFVAAFKHVRSNSIVNLVSQEELLPSCRDVFNLYARECLGPQSVTYYDTLRDVPLMRIDRRNSAFLTLVATNVEISAKHWRFDTGNLRELCGYGYTSPRATLDSLHVCQRAFVANSHVLPEFIRTKLRRSTVDPHDLAHAASLS